MELAGTLDSSKHVLVNLSGRGDKDVDTVMAKGGLVEELNPDRKVVKADVET